MFLLVDQYIDRTFAREKTFFGPGFVAHVSMAEPVCPVLGDALEAAGRQLFAHHCTACHSLDTSENAFGPSLFGALRDLFGGYDTVLAVAAGFELAAMAVVLAGRSRIRTTAQHKDDSAV